MIELVPPRADLRKGRRVSLESAIRFGKAHEKTVVHRDDRLVDHEYVIQVAGEEDRIFASRLGIERLAVAARAAGGTYHRGTLIQPR